MSSAFDWRQRHGKKKIAAMHDGAVHGTETGTSHGRPMGQGVKTAVPHKKHARKGVTHKGNPLNRAHEAALEAPLGTSHTGNKPGQGTRCAHDYAEE